MQVTGNNRIAVCIAKDGFTINTGCARSEWLGAGLVFSTGEFREKWDSAQISVFTPKFALVPDAFFEESAAREILSGTVALSDSDQVESVAISSIAAHAVYSVNDGGQLARVICDSLAGASVEVYPEQYWQLQSLQEIADYNKIVASYDSRRIYLTVAQGRTLLLCNSYPATDFVTAQYWIFLVMRSLQLNPEVSSIWFRTPLASEQEMSLYNYFKSVEAL